MNLKDLHGKNGVKFLFMDDVIDRRLTQKPVYMVVLGKAFMTIVSLDFGTACEIGDNDLLLASEVVQLSI